MLRFFVVRAEDIRIWLQSFHAVIYCISVYAAGAAVIFFSLPWPFKWWYSRW